MIYIPKDGEDHGNVIILITSSIRTRDMHIPSIYHDQSLLRGSLCGPCETRVHDHVYEHNMHLQNMRWIDSVFIFV